MSAPQSSPVSRGAALRLALAARALPGIPIDRFVRAVGDRFGLPLTEDTLARITVKDIKELIQGDEIIEPAMSSDCIKEAVRHLWGDGQDGSVPVPQVHVPAAERSLRVAVASNSAENLDGHFGSCLRFLIYQVAGDGIWLIDVRSAINTDEAQDRNAARTGLIADCHVLCVQSIGGPAAAKVIRANVHPLKFPNGGEARPELLRLQTMLASPPPWIARALGGTSTLAERFGDAWDEDDKQ